jgi:hypothetical protein
VSSLWQHRPCGHFLQLKGLQARLPFCLIQHASAPLTSTTSMISMLFPNTTLCLCYPILSNLPTCKTLRPWSCSEGKHSLMVCLMYERTTITPPSLRQLSSPLSFSKSVSKNTSQTNLVPVCATWTGKASRLPARSIRNGALTR